MVPWEMARELRVQKMIEAVSIPLGISAKMCVTLRDVSQANKMGPSWTRHILFTYYRSSIATRIINCSWMAFEWLKERLSLNQQQMLRGAIEIRPTLSQRITKVKNTTVFGTFKECDWHLLIALSEITKSFLREITLRSTSVTGNLCTISSNPFVSQLKHPPYVRSVENN